MLKFSLIFLLTVSLPLGIYCVAANEEEEGINPIPSNNTIPNNATKPVPSSLEGNEEKDISDTILNTIERQNETATEETGTTGSTDESDATGTTEESDVSTTTEDDDETTILDASTSPDNRTTEPPPTVAPPGNSSEIISTSSPAGNYTTTDETPVNRSTFPTVTPLPETSLPTGQPSPSKSRKSGPPTWALVLMSLLISFSLLFTAFFLLRRYCVRKRKEERRYLLSARSQEGYFFGEQSGEYGNSL